ncbi:MAG: 7-carboxy-7-deazaguanine synthase QueE [Gammaproteobacteria bacterium]|nr:7-carboxy-7-deazaguanine synthase QueE [Gammaproteobacteria bacterium]
MQNPTLRITEIFYSIQGESSFSGIPTVFIRLTGCPLRCQYCDTAYAFSGGELLSVASILETTSQYNTRHVTVTGGEPLAQDNTPALLSSLIQQGYTVSLETSGAIDVSDVSPEVIKIMDIKTPGSGELHKNKYSNIDCLDSKDEIKFVICNDEDYNWSKQLIDQYQLTNRCQILFSASSQQYPATRLAEKILDDQLPVRFQIQLHKLLWDDAQGK